MTSSLPGNIQIGTRASRQRQAVLEVLSRAKGHMPAVDIYQKVQKKFPRVSLGTIYRNLKTLKEAGLIEEIHLDEHTHYYEIKTGGEHYHLLCLGCGKVVEFKYPLEYILSNVPEASGFRVLNTDLRFSGYCDSCSKNEDSR
ncbi:MAG: transcriptional repressor [Dehalococcoides mccartyi]|uniref:Fur family transcriptional regulator n=1 Tax=Dehalococcoides mccartyi TaxID=61435 RepID=UPI000804B6E8|nr:transcriptional repressor [Dehalococcoides mccartyi]OBW63378.1 MAG: transcriptional repressor [Dehalococcoides mccartyi]